MRGPADCCAHHSRNPSNYWCYVTHYIPTFFLGLKFVNHDLTRFSCVVGLKNIQFIHPVKAHIIVYIFFMEAHNNIFLWPQHLYHNFFFVAPLYNHYSFPASFFFFLIIAFLHSNYYYTIHGFIKKKSKNIIENLQWNKFFFFFLLRRYNEIDSKNNRAEIDLSYSAKSYQIRPSFYQDKNLLHIIFYGNYYTLLK